MSILLLLLRLGSIYHHPPESGYHKISHKERFLSYSLCRIAKEKKYFSHVLMKFGHSLLQLFSIGCFAQMIWLVYGQIYDREPGMYHLAKSL
jgi:hypothetical protein